MMATNYTAALAKALGQAGGYTRNETIPFYAGSQGLSNIASVIPQMGIKNPWITALATGLTSAAGAGLQGYGMIKDNQLEQQAMKDYVGSLGSLGYAIPDGVTSAVTSKDPHVRELGMGLIGPTIDAAAARQDRKNAVIDAVDQAKQIEQNKINLNAPIDAAKTAEDAKNGRFGLENSLATRANADKDITAFGEASRVFPSLVDAYETRGAGSAANLIYGAARMLAPTGAITENDFNSLASLGDLGTKFQGYLNKLKDGGDLPDTVYDELFNLSRSRFDALQKAAAPKLASIGNTTNQYGLNIDNIGVSPTAPTSERVMLDNPKARMGYIQSQAQAAGLDPLVAGAMGQVESGGNLDPNAKSSKGAIGPMQLMPDTAKGLGVDPTDTKQNIEGGVKYLASLVKKYNGDYSLALAEYNAGGVAVDKYGGVPPFQETQDYIHRIITKVGPDKFPVPPGKALVKANGKYAIVTKAQADLMARGSSQAISDISQKLSQSGAPYG